MFRGLVLAVAVLTTLHADVLQTLGVLHIKVVIVDGSGKATPVPRHRLQISDNPATALPRRVITSPEGTVDVRLPAGNYSVESERPVNFEGKSYQWAIVVDVANGREAMLELSGKNAEVGPLADVEIARAASSEPDPASLLGQWQDSLVQIWTATTHGSGFLIDSKGLIAADLQVVGAAASVEVQLSPTVKVAGAVIATDPVRGIALVGINPSIASSAKALPLECERPPESLAVGQTVTALEAPLGRDRGMTEGAVESVLANAIDTDLVSSIGGSGGPAFAPNGRLIGITTQVPGNDGARSDRTRIVRLGRVCDFIATVAEKIKVTPPPSSAHLPVEPLKPFPSRATDAATPVQAAKPSLRRAASSEFDIVFITPSQLLATRGVGETPDTQSLRYFSNWSDYVETTPPVLLVRVTPKFAESFWTKVARGVAMTQGASIPPIKRPKSNFARMRALCGDKEITPVHPFQLVHRQSAKETFVEGLYVFDPGALAPNCATVTLQMFSEKEPRKADTLVVDPKLIQQIWQDFAPYRE